jgi:isopenicillin N synthase-like dioxygenase
VINHGIPPASVASLREAAREFFGLPIEEKLKVKRSADNPLGYNDGELTKNTRDWKEVFDIATHGVNRLPGDGDGDGDDDDDTAQVLPNRWPSEMPLFR